MVNALLRGIVSFLIKDESKNTNEEKGQFAKQIDPFLHKLNNCNKLFLVL